MTPNRYRANCRSPLGHYGAEFLSESRAGTWESRAHFAEYALGCICLTPRLIEGLRAEVVAQLCPGPHPMGEHPREEGEPTACACVRS